MTYSPDKPPLVTIIIPVRNEQANIRQCLDAVAAQDYPACNLEVFVVDGMSTDATRAIVAEYCQRFSHIQQIDNPRRVVPTALNIGFKLSTGEIIIRVDGHCIIARDYVRQSVALLLRSDASNVGGAMRAKGIGHIPLAIALATSSPFGVGNARFHYSEAEEYVDTVYLGAYHRDVFDRIGLFDEELVRNQDDELNYRLRAAGGKILLSPAIQSHYVGRGSMRDLFRQYFQYGYWKVRVAQKHPRSLLPRHLAPAAFVLALLSVGLSGIISKWARVLGALVVTAYLAASLGFAARSAARHGRRYVPTIVVAFACLHVGYGTGFLAGLLRLLERRGRPWVRED